MEVYVVGHVKPDTDSVVSAIVVAEWARKEFGWDARPVMAGEPNPETEFVFKHFGMELPERIGNGEGKDFFLVDHNEEKQRVEGMEVDRIHGILDHHKFSFSNSRPIWITVRPVGSTATLAYGLCKDSGVELSRGMKGLVLSAILSDTVILRSPTTTDLDREIASELAEELGIDIERFGMEMFSAKSEVAKLSPRELITKDFKEFSFSGRKVGIGQVEVVDLSLVEQRFGEILEEMERMRGEGFHTVLLMVTDIVRQGSVLLCSSEEMERVEKAFGQFRNGISEFKEGMMSRKKQVVPEMEKAFEG